MNNIRERYIAELKDKAILFAWIMGLLLFISLLWILTQPLQSNYLMRTVNNIFINNDDDRRLSASLPVRSEDRQDLNLLGYWYAMFNSTDKMFIFAAFQDGILVPLGAIVSQNGNVNEILPLSAHAEQIFDTLPESVLRMYTARIESSVRQINTEGNR